MCTFIASIRQGARKWNKEVSELKLAQRSTNIAGQINTREEFRVTTLRPGDPHFMDSMSLAQ